MKASNGVYETQLAKQLALELKENVISFCNFLDLDLIEANDALTALCGTCYIVASELTTLKAKGIKGNMAYYDHVNHNIEQALNVFKRDLLSPLPSL